MRKYLTYCGLIFSRIRAQDIIAPAFNIGLCGLSRIYNNSILYHHSIHLKKGFKCMEWNWNGTGMEQEWDRNGTGMEQEWNRNGTGMEQE